MLVQRMRDFSRWHIEKNLLALALRPDTQGKPPVRVADALFPGELVSPGEICYCAGVGEDIRLENHLADVCGADVWAFDPTPRSIAYMQRTPHDPARLRFLPVGLWKDDVTLHFHPPANTSHVSHSVMEANGSGGFDAPCRSVVSLMRELGHDRIDVLKMNIEGAEHIVLDAALTAGLRPRIITLTFEGKSAFRKALRWTKLLRQEGYQFLGRLGWFFTYVRPQTVGLAGASSTARRSS